jgi:hypothetical protein
MCTPVRIVVRAAFTAVAENAELQWQKTLFFTANLLNYD